MKKKKGGGKGKERRGKERNGETKRKGKGKGKKRVGRKGKGTIKVPQGFPSPHLSSPKSLQVL